MDQRDDNSKSHPVLTVQFAIDAFFRLPSCAT